MSQLRLFVNVLLFVNGIRLWVESTQLAGDVKQALYLALDIRRLAMLEGAGPYCNVRVLV